MSNVSNRLAIENLSGIFYLKDTAYSIALLNNSVENTQANLNQIDDTEAFISFL